MITVNGNRKVTWREGMTVAALLAELEWSYALITVTVNGEFVPRDDYHAHAVPDEAVVQAIHIAHGG